MGADYYASEMPGLPTIGIGPNKLVAKTASDFQKPDGLTVVEEKDVKAFLAPLDIDKLLWVGKKTARKLRELGINTIGDMANYDPSVLTEVTDQKALRRRLVHLVNYGPGTPFACVGIARVHERFCHPVAL
jgi:DNA polymerase IV (DinB-like DNA polymerase)